MASDPPVMPGQPAAPGGAQPVASLLAAVAVEVNDLARLSDSLQSLISSALVADCGTDIGHLREFQAIDLLVQRLQGVAAYVEELSRAAAADWRLDPASALARLTLADLARCLAGQAGAIGAEPQALDPSGDLQLFG